MAPGPRSGLAKAILLWSAAAAWAGAIFYLSSLPNPLPTLMVRASDKVLHALEYAGLAAFVSLGLRASGVRPRRALALAIAAASMYAASDEIHQAFVPGRDSEILDWVADSLGACAAALLVHWAGRQRG